MTDLYATHSAILDQALATIHSREYWSAFSESPSPRVYGETAKADAELAFAALLNKPFELAGHPADAGHTGSEHSPYGMALGVTYPSAKIDTLIAVSKAAGALWAKTSIEARTGILLEMLARINKASFLIAHAVQHTTGQAFMMAFQAGGPHAQDRALEAIAYAYSEMVAVPSTTLWQKPQGKAEPIVLEKTFRIIPRGVALAIGCATFPTWNSYPGMFASLATGNSLIVKPHPNAILPLALSIHIMREVLTEQRLDPNIILLAPDTMETPLTKELATHKDIAIIDFTGGPVFGKWLRTHVHGKQIYTEEAGVNSIVIDSTNDFRGMCSNIAFSVSLYSGQMCTAPQDIFVPAKGIKTNDGHKSFDEVGAGIATAIDKLLSDPDRAAGILGTVQSEATIARVEAASGIGKTLRASSAIEIAGHSKARTASPLLLAVDATEESAYMEERFGPIALVVRTATTGVSIRLAADLAKSHGAITAAVYSTNEEVIDQAADAFADAGVALSVNLTGNIFVNQSAAFSDYHVTGANPAGNASLTDSAFVANRFRVAAMRRPRAQA